MVTFISLVFALSILFYPLTFTDQEASWLSLFVTLAGTAFLLIVPLLHILIFIPLQRLEEQGIPHLVELFRHDKGGRIKLGLLLLFPLLSYIAASSFIFLDHSYIHILFAIWIVLFGLGLDLILDVLKRSTYFLNPFHLVTTFTHDAQRAIRTEKDETLWQSLDNLSEMALLSTEKNKIALVIQILNAFPQVIHTFFASSKSISRVSLDEEVEKETGQDEASYTLFYLLQRLSLINDKAIRHHLETVCCQLIMVLGKIIVHSAKYDLSMVSLPTNTLGKCTLKAYQHHLDEVIEIAMSTLLEISKTIIQEVDLTYAALTEPFMTIINDLDLMAKATFKRNKNINIKVLMQPFLVLKELFKNEKVAQHRDTPIVLKDIDRVLAEFEALEQVMRTIPPIPAMESEGSGS